MFPKKEMDKIDLAIKEGRLVLAKDPMPKGTKVHKVYDRLLAKGYSKGAAARIAQAQTKQSLKTGKKTHG